MRTPTRLLAATAALLILAPATSAVASTTVHGKDSDGLPVKLTFRGSGCARHACAVTFRIAFKVTCGPVGGPATGAPRTVTTTIKARMAGPASQFGFLGFASKDANGLRQNLSFDVAAKKTTGSLQLAATGPSTTGCSPVSNFLSFSLRYHGVP